MAKPVERLPAKTHHFAGNPDHRALGRHFLQNDRIGPDIRLVSNFKGAKNFGTRSDDDVIADGRVAFALFLAAPAKSNSLIDNHVIPNFASFPNDDAHAMVNEQPIADPCSRMNLDSRKKAAGLRNDPSDREPPTAIESMRQPMAPYGMQPGVGEDDLEPASR